MEVWEETFPNDRRRVGGRIQARREQAQMMAKYSPEEIEKM